jgi:transposase
MPHRNFLEATRAEQSDITLQALCDRLSAERGVKADTSMMSRFFRKLGVTLKKDPRRIARTSAAIARAGAPIRGSSIPGV